MADLQRVDEKDIIHLGSSGEHLRFYSATFTMSYFSTQIPFVQFASHHILLFYQRKKWHLPWILLPIPSKNWALRSLLNRGSVVIYSVGESKFYVALLDTQLKFTRLSITKWITSGVSSLLGVTMWKFQCLLQHDSCPMCRRRFLLQTSEEPADTEAFVVNRPYFWNEPPSNAGMYS